MTHMIYLYCDKLEKNESGIEDAIFTNWIQG
jgi:hypothetical protein